MITIPLDALTPDPANARTVGTDIADLTASIASVGLLQPILVRPREANGNGAEGWAVVAGNRRVAACRALGMTEIQAVIYQPNDNGESYALAASAAENMVRRPMHPVDQWLAMQALIDNGTYTATGAAEALGVSVRMARRLARLGRMDRKVIDALALEAQMPADHVLRAIATAPHDHQGMALAQATGKGGAVDWAYLASLCEQKRLSREIAIFDPAAIAWDEDLFAEPGAADEFTTTDIGSFLSLQRAALEQRIEASKGRMIAAEFDERRGDLVAPSGFVFTWEPVPKRWRKADPRKLAVGVIPFGWSMGRIEERVVAPRAAPPKDAADEPGVTSRRAREPVTKAVQANLAIIKTTATRQAVSKTVQAWAEQDCWTDVVRLLLLALAANNLRIEGGHDWRPQRLAALALKNASLGQAVAEAVNAIVAFDKPDAGYGTSGEAAEWIGEMVRAETYLPRFDTAEILGGIAGDKLIEIAEANGIDSSGRRKDLIARLTGALPCWRPVSFGAPAPQPAIDDDEEETGDED